MRIALLEDDSDQALLVSEWLKQEGHDCVVFSQGKALLRVLMHETFDLLILDWMLPDIEGIEVLLWARERLDWWIPAVFITSRDTEEDVVRALEAGADDYMPKPVTKAEMLSRVKALLRRSITAPETSLISYPPYVFDMRAYTVKLNGEIIDLTNREFELACFLFKNHGRILSRAHILDVVWGAQGEINTRTVDTHMSRVRAKLQLRGEHSWWLRSIYQHGYRLVPSSEIDLGNDGADLP